MLEIPFKDSWLHNKFMNETWGEKLPPGVNASVFFIPQNPSQHNEHDLLFKLLIWLRAVVLRLRVGRRRRNMPGRKKNTSKAEFQWFGLYQNIPLLPSVKWSRLPQKQKTGIDCDHITMEWFILIKYLPFNSKSRQKVATLIFQMSVVLWRMLPHELSTLWQTIASNLSLSESTNASSRSTMWGQITTSRKAKAASLSSPRWLEIKGKKPSACKEEELCHVCEDVGLC